MKLPAAPAVWHTGCLHAGPPSGTCLLLFARPESSTSPWTACASPPQRAFSSGRGQATATLILHKRSSLWTTCKHGSCPSRPPGEEPATRPRPLAPPLL